MEWPIRNLLGGDYLKYTTKMVFGLHLHRNNLSYHIIRITIEWCFPPTSAIE
jgi:hypothetical protein